VICQELPGPWYAVQRYLTDGSGNIVPIRTGKSDSQAQGTDTGANYNHASVDHNLCGQHVMASLFENNHRHDAIGKGDKRFNPKERRYKYEGGVFDRSSGQELIAITAIASDAHVGFDDPTPDGRPFGMVTAFCENYTRCPDMVNQL
jgi:hypothetical protein